MTSRNQRWYYLKRAQDSLQRSAEAGDPAIVAVHKEFYRLYMKRANEGLDAGVRLVTIE